MEDAAILAGAEYKAMASARAGTMCSDGMVDRNMAAQWAAVDAACNASEKQRQALLHERNRELSVLASASDAHRKEVLETRAAKRLILDEMRVVRSRMEDKVVSARGRGAHNMGVANRSLTLAGQKALSARHEAERWQARANDVQVLFASKAEREAELLAGMQEASRARASEAEANSAERKQLGQRLVDETTSQCEQLQRRHHENSGQQELYARKSAELKMWNAARVQQEATSQVQAAIAKSSSEQWASVHEIHKSREAAFAKISQAQQEFLEKRRECEATLERERICAAQARKIASTLKAQQDSARDAEAVKSQARIDLAQHLSQQKAAAYEVETKLAAERNEAWAVRGSEALTSAQVRVADEETQCIASVDQAKISFAKLQAQCLAYLGELQEMWEESKKEDAARVEAARVRTEDIANYCAHTAAKCDQYCEDRIRRTNVFSSEKSKALEEKVAVIDDLAKHRVEMAARQSKDRREKAEAKVVAFMAHVEEVRAQCSERVKVEAATAEEKVEMARQRFEEEVALAEKRQAEAEALRDTARAAHAAVISRSVGSAMEARRRGLNSIADVIEPEPYPRYSGWDAPVDREETKAIDENSVMPQDTPLLKDNDPLMATNLTDSDSTAIPESLMASMSTTREIASR